MATSCGFDGLGAGGRVAGGLVGGFGFDGTGRAGVGLGKRGGPSFSIVSINLLPSQTGSSHPFLQISISHFKNT